MILKKRKLSLSNKLTLIYSLILLGILIAFTFITFFSISNFILKENQGELLSNTDIITKYITNQQIIDRESLNRINLSEGISYNLFDENNNLIYSSKNIQPTLPKHFDDKKREIKNKNFEHKMGQVSTSRIINIKGYNYYLQVTKEFEDIGYKTDALKEILVITSILGTLICFISGYFLTNKFLKPIKDITKAAKDITSNSLNMRIPMNGADDELKELAQTFNSMIERLERDFEKQKRFVSDASHELRTPLAVIYGHVNMLNRWGKDDKEVLNKSLSTLKSEAENMNRLIENLLYLAKGDNNVLIMKKENFELYSLLSDIVEETILNHSDICISLQCEEEIKINADYNAIKELIRILIDNSIKFSPNDGKIIISAIKKDKGTLISVKDNGIGIPKEKMPYIFERFYRADESRTKKMGGTGLGLSIAKQIVDMHNGEIFAQSQVSEGTTINIYLPKV